MRGAGQLQPRYVKSQAVKTLENLALQALKRSFPSFPYPVKPKYSDSSANGLTKCIIDYIRLRGFQAERINTTGRQITIGNSLRFVKGSCQVGSADISATIQGRSVKIEVKCGNDVQSKAQEDYQAQIEAAGGVYLLVRDFQSFYNWFNKRGGDNGK